MIVKNYHGFFFDQKVVFKLQNTMNQKITDSKVDNFFPCR